MTLKDRRHELGLTQAAVSQSVGVDVRLYRRWENAERSIPTGRLFSLARVFQMTVDNVLKSWAEMDAVDAIELRRVT
jgi:transcriptional regulator with XRE-family HTH domain